MLLRRDKSPIDGIKLNKLLTEIRSGQSRYIEIEINDLVKKCSWRKYHPPKWLWGISVLILFVNLLLGVRTELGFIMAMTIFLIPFIGMTMANEGYKSYNQLKSILKDQ